MIEPSALSHNLSTGGVRFSLEVVAPMVYEQRRERAILDELPDVVQRRCIACRDWWPDDGEFYPRFHVSIGGKLMPRCWACELEREARKREQQRIAKGHAPLPARSGAAHVRRGGLTEREASVLAALRRNDGRYADTARELGVTRNYLSVVASHARANGIAVPTNSARVAYRLPVPA